MSVNRAEFQRPSWDNIYLAMAFIFSQRSHDAETKHGCVITDAEHRILSCGCNGFPKGMDDINLPNKRPDKYAWMVHSERNALANCVIRPPGGSVAYVTGQCCNECMFALWQEGIADVVMADLHGSHLIDEEVEKVWDHFVDVTGVNVTYVEPNFNFLVPLMEKFREYNFTTNPNAGNEPLSPYWPKSCVD